MVGKLRDNSRYEIILCAHAPISTTRARNPAGTSLCLHDVRRRFTFCSGLSCRLSVRYAHAKQTRSHVATLQTSLAVHRHRAVLSVLLDPQRSDSTYESMEYPSHQRRRQTPALGPINVALPTDVGHTYLRRLDGMGAFFADKMALHLNVYCGGAIFGVHPYMVYP